MDLVGLCARLRFVRRLWVAGDQPTSGRGQAGGVLTVPFWCSSCEGGPVRCDGHCARALPFTRMWGPAVPVHANKHLLVDQRLRQPRA